MYLDAHFNDLFREINPKDEGVRRAQKAHTDVRDFLASPEGLGDLYSDSFLAGSYARDTAIDPIKDVDVVIITNYREGEANATPLAVLRKLRATLQKCYENTDTETANQRRSIRVELEGLSMDIIPAIAPDGAWKPIRIPDRKLETWIWTNPRGHITLGEERSAASDQIGGQFIYKPTVKLLRWWKHEQLPAQRNPKGFLVEMMAYDTGPMRATHWAEAMANTLENIAAKYRGSSALTAPVFTDPAMTGQEIKTKLTGPEFSTFFSKLDEARSLLDRAIKAEDQEEAAKLYCQLFVKGFPCPESGKRAPVLVGSERRVTQAPRFA